PAARRQSGGGGSAGRRRPRGVHGGADPRHADLAGPGDAAHAALQVLPGQLDVGGGPAVAGGATRPAHRTATAPAATTVGRLPPTGDLTRGLLRSGVAESTVA